MRLPIAAFLVPVVCHAPAAAGAWTQPPEHTLAILKSTSGVEFGAAPAPLAQTSVSLFVERGVTSDLSVEFQTGIQSSSYAGARRSGLGEQAAGLKYRLGRWRNVVASGYLGERVLFDLGVGPFARDRPDWRQEFRALVGANYRILGRDCYVDIGGAALYGGGSRLQVRGDATLGVAADRVTTLTISSRYGENVRDAYPSAWKTLEATAVRKFGRWRIEAGWGRTITSPRFTAKSGPILAVWRTF